MKVITPVTIDDGRLLDSTLVEQLPVSTSATSYSQWSAGTTYAVGDVVCWIYGTNAASPNPYSHRPKFGIFRSLVAGRSNLEPGLQVWEYVGSGTNTLPGYWAWELVSSWPVYSSTTIYSAGMTVGRISGGTGATYQSLQASNGGNDPVSSPTWWRQSAVINYASWAGGTTYALGEYTALFSGSRAQVFKSLQAGNTGHDPSSSPTWWQYVGETFKVWDAATTYASGDTVIDLRTHHVYESQAAANLNFDPTAAVNRPAKWVDLGATNRWAMFDQVTSTASIAGDTLSFTVSLPSLCDTLALMDMVAATVRVQIAVSGSTVYDQTFDLADNSMITDWRHWFFDPLSRKSDLILNDLPLALGAIATVTVSNPDTLVAVGSAVFGLATDLGATVYGATPGILDFSVKQTDDFGVTTLVERPFAKRCAFKVEIARDQVDSVQKFLTGIRATPAVFQGSNNYASTWIFGFYKDFSLSIDYPTVSYLSLEIEGLT